MGVVTRIDPRSGRKSTFASGLPPAILPIGGAIDVAFIGRTAYVLVSLVGEFGGGADGIYQVEGPDEVTPIADMGTWSSLHLPPTHFDLLHGVQFALQPMRDGFLVTDGHHNRLLHVTLDGNISALRQFENIVPTGLSGEFGTACMAELGPLPNLPEDGKVIAVSLLSPDADQPPVASGVPMIVDVERGPDGRLYALSQGDPDLDMPAGSPALEGTGRLLEVKHDGTFRILAQHLDRPTSLSFACADALVVTLTGDVIRFRDLAPPRCTRNCGHRH